MSEMVIHGPIAVNNYWAFQIFYTMTITFIAYLAIVNIVDNDIKYEKLIKYWLVINIFLAIVGFIKKGKGVGGFLGDENDFCMALNMILPFSLFGIFSAKTKSGKMYCIFITCFFLFVVILTQSRGGFVGLVAVAVYCWLRTKKKVVLAFMMGLLVVFALLIAPTEYWEEVKSINDESTMTYGTGGQRIYAWKLGWKMFIDNPIMGVGQGNYPWNVMEAEEQMGMSWQTRSLSGRAAHSLYFTLLPELGLIGTILYGMMLIYSLKDLKYLKNISKMRQKALSKDDSNRIYYLALACEGSLVGFLVSSVFISTLYYPNFWILCGFIVSFKKITYDKFGDIKFTNKYVVPKNI